MDIFITGHTGFIGQHLTERLQGDHSLTFLDGDIRDFRSVQDQVAAAQPDVIVHLAARTEVEKSFYEPTEFSQVNYVGTVNLIEAARSALGVHFVFASTMEVYGHQPQSDGVQRGLLPGQRPEPFNEHTQPHPNAPYAVAKLGCEKYLEYAGRAYGMSYTILRQTNTYGRKDNDFFVVEQIITQMLKGDTVNLGNRLPWRNFLYIDDMISCWETVIRNPDKTQGIYTMGPDNALPIWELVDRIGSKLQWHGSVNWGTKPKRPGEVYYLGSTHDRLTDHTGWRPRINLDRGLDLTIEHWRKKLNK